MGRQSDRHGVGPVKNPVKRPVKRRRQTVVLSSDESDDSDEETDKRTDHQEMDGLRGRVSPGYAPGEDDEDEDDDEGDISSYGGDDETPAPRGQTRKSKPASSRKKRRAAPIHRSSNYGLIPAPPVARPPRQPRSVQRQPKVQAPLCDNPKHSCAPSEDGKAFSPHLDPCAYLDGAKMFRSDYGICCLLCQCFVEDNSLESHLKRSQHGLKPKAAKAASDHILATGEKPPKIDLLSAVLTEPIPALGKPCAGYRCPEPDCMKWVGQVEKFAHEQADDPRKKAESIWNHGVKEHRWKAGKMLLFKLRYFYRVYGQVKPEAVVAFEEGWSPPKMSTAKLETMGTDAATMTTPFQAPVNRPAGYLAPGANFIEDMGFNEYLDGTKASKRRLKTLVKRPDVQFAASRMSHRERAMEETLLQLSDGLEDYLLEAGEFAGSDNSVIREALTAGYVLTLPMLKA